MKLVTVSGTTGSGKTTLIRALVERFGEEGKRSSIIVNEDGDTKYDEAFVRTHDLAVERLQGG